MPKFMLEFIELCYCCNDDISTLGNMRNLVIPRLQQAASEIRQVVGDVPAVFLCRAELEADAEALEAAISAGIRRCQLQPIQQDLFAA